MRETSLPSIKLRSALDLRAVKPPRLGNRLPVAQAPPGTKSRLLSCSVFHYGSGMTTTSLLLLDSVRRDSCIGDVGHASDRSVALFLLGRDG